MFWTPIVPHVKECITILHTLDCGRAALNSDLKKISIPSQERLSPIFLWCYITTWLFEFSNELIWTSSWEPIWNDIYVLYLLTIIMENVERCREYYFFSDPTLMTMATVCGQTVLRSYSQLSGSHVKVSESWSWLEQNHFVTCQNLHKNHQVCHARGRIRIVFIMDLKFSCWQHQNCRVCTEKKSLYKVFWKIPWTMD